MVTTMTNERNNQLFNEKRKHMFLHDIVNSGNITELTSKSYARIFLITKSHEESLSKDLADFTFEELETIMYGFKANNRNTVESYSRIISSYFNWNVKNGYINENPLGNLKPDDFEKYLTNTEEYITEKQLRRFEDLCANYQDAVIMRLAFSGVTGKQMSEIRNLKKSDVDFENKRLRLTNTLKADKQGFPLKFTERYIDVDQRTLDLIQGAIQQKIYHKKNGEMEETATNNVRLYTDLVDSDYIVRASITKTQNWNCPVDRYVIYRRIETISKSLGIEDLTLKLLQRSGIIYTASNLIEDSQEKISTDDLKIVGDRFNMKSYHNLKGFLTIENILKTYKKD